MDAEWVAESYCVVTLRNGDGKILGQMSIPATEDMRNLSADWSFAPLEGGTP